MYSPPDTTLHGWAPIPVNKLPSPTKEVAVTVPTIFVLPITCSLYPFAVVPIPTPPFPSIETWVVPEPTRSLEFPGEVVAIPTWSKV